MSSDDNFFDQITESGDANMDQTILIRDCFHRFRNKEDDALYLRDFHEFLQELLTDIQDVTDPVVDDKLKDMFDILDEDSDDKIDEREFTIAWRSFVMPIVKPKCALIIIDVQNDFIDGSLAIRNCPAGQDGLDVVPVINKLLNTISFPLVIYSYDWHPENHVSFADNVHLRSFHQNSPVQQSEAKVFDTVVFEGPPPTEQKLWPRHCVQESWGSQLHPELKIADDAVFIYKGSSPEIDSYSAFYDNQKRSQTDLVIQLKSRGITDVYICGLAFDYCVGYTALHALEHGFRTVLVEDACRGVAEEDIIHMKDNLISNHASVVTSDAVSDMLTARKRTLALAYFTALRIKRNRS